MSDNLEEALSLQHHYSELSEDEKQQINEDLREVVEKTRKMGIMANETAKSLRIAAKELDEVWKDCKIAHAAGTSAGIVGGVLTIGGGIATMMSGGIAAPLLSAGMGFGAAGAVTNLGASFVEATINSKKIKKAENDLKETFDCINDVKNTVEKVLTWKEEARVLYILSFAVQALELTDPARKYIQEVALRLLSIPSEIGAGFMSIAEGIASAIQRRQTGAGNAISQVGAKQAGAQTAGDVVLAGTKVGAQMADDVMQAGAKAGAQVADDVMQAGAKAGAQVADDVMQAGAKAGAQAADDVAQTGAKAGAQAGSKLAGGLIIAVSIPFLVFDAIDLGVTIRDLIEEKGSEAAKFLRERADELEKLC